jgi:hypothetical protein
LTSADVVFSLRRLVNLQGNPSFLLFSGAYDVDVTQVFPK